MNKIPLELLGTLQNKLNLCVRNNSCKSFYEAAEILQKIRDDFQQLDSNNKDDKLIDTALLLRSILFPFTVKIIDFKNENISQKMTSFILWWIKKKPDKAPNKQIIEVLAEKRIYQLENLAVKDCENGKQKLILERPIRQVNNAMHAHMNYLFALFEIKTFGQDCDDLINLTMWLMNEKIEVLPSKEKKR